MITAEDEDSDNNAGMCKVPTIAMHCTESFGYIISFNTHNTSIIQTYYYPHLTVEEVEEQRG